ncbi:MAG: hypothetical protein ABIK93_07770 [candidate division WOR-3 bacterium]
MFLNSRLATFTVKPTLKIEGRAGKWFFSLVIACLLTISAKTSSAKEQTLVLSKSKFFLTQTLVAQVTIVPTGMQPSETWSRPVQFQLTNCDSTERREIVKIPDRWFAIDKVYHLVVSFSLVGSGYHLLANRIEVKEPYSTVGSVGGTFALGITKEFYDAVRPEDRFSYRDLIYDIFGIVLGYFVFIH